MILFATIFMNSENSKTSDPHRLILSLKDNINLKRSDKYVGSAIYGKIKKIHKKTINLKDHLLREIANLNYLIYYILYLMLKINLSISLKEYETMTDSAPIRICVKKIENRITFITLQIMKELGSIKNK